MEIEDKLKMLMKHVRNQGEKDFFADVYERSVSFGILTPKQMAIIEKKWDAYYRAGLLPKELLPVEELKGCSSCDDGWILAKDTDKDHNYAFRCSCDAGQALSPKIPDWSRYSCLSRYEKLA